MRERPFVLLAALVAAWAAIVLEGPAAAKTSAAHGASHAAAPASVSADPALVCNQAIAATERGSRLPAQLLGTIAIIESGRREPKTGRVQPWPWTINAENAGSFYDTKEQAIAAVQALQARGVKSIDVGCMQVNLMHHADAFSSLDEAFDPRANVTYAGRFLNQLFAQLATWPKAAAAYHSQTPEIGADYGRRVMANWPLAARFAEGWPGLPPPPIPSVYTAEFASQVARDEAVRTGILAEMRFALRSGPMARAGHGKPDRERSGPGMASEAAPKLRSQLAELVRPVSTATFVGQRDPRR